jgi:hypothetical protein
MIGVTLYYAHLAAFSCFHRGETKEAPSGLRTVAFCQEAVTAQLGIVEHGRIFS